MSKSVGDVAASATANGHQFNDGCSGFWQTPRDCSREKGDCTFFASWETIGRGGDMRFHLETSNTDTWTGVGFSKNQLMVCERTLS